MTVSTRELAQRRRDACFKALCDILVERQRLLAGQTKQYGRLLEGEYMTQEAVHQMRMEPHKLMDEAMAEWDRTSDLGKQLALNNDEHDNKISLLDPQAKKEKTQEISLTLRQLQLKHQQLMNLMRT